MRLSIIIVNYKTPQLVLDCISSIYRFDTSHIEIIVVDNDSNDGLEELLKAFPEVKFVQMGYNSGFARANNKGINAASGDVVLLLNSDTIVEDNAVNIAFSGLIASDYVACGVQLLNEDRSPQISGNFAMRGGLNYLLPLPYVGRLILLAGKLFKVKKPNVPDATGVVEVDWINGAFLMVKEQAIKKAGLLDEDFFLYAEEAEWCSRLRKEGKLCIFGSEHVIHLQGASANDAFVSDGGYFNLYDRKGLQIMLSNFVRIRKEFGVFWLLFNYLIYLLTVPVFFLILFLSKLFFIKKPGYYFSQWQLFTKNIFIILTYLPRIIKNEPYFYKVL